jgi:hypothetical protein
MAALFVDKNGFYRASWSLVCSHPFDVWLVHAVPSLSPWPSLYLPLHHPTDASSAVDDKAPGVFKPVNGYTTDQVYKDARFKVGLSVHGHTRAM